MLIFTCEHASHDLPKRYRNSLSISDDILLSHRGWDLGAKTACKHFASHFKVSAYYGEITRLLVDLNRSTHKNACFSELTKPLTDTLKNQLLERYYFSFRSIVKNAILSSINENTPNALVLHLSIHSFTPTLNGKARNNDIGILYDPQRDHEAQFARHWKNALQTLSQGTLKIRMNYPYRGIADGHTTALRKVISKSMYIGIELEINQRFFDPNTGRFPKPLLTIITKGLEQAIRDLEIRYLR